MVRSCLGQYRLVRRTLHVCCHWLHSRQHLQSKMVVGTNITHNKHSRASATRLPRPKNLATEEDIPNYACFSFPFPLVFVLDGPGPGFGPGKAKPCEEEWAS